MDHHLEGGSPTVAVVDDDPAIRTVFDEMLRDVGYRTVLWDGLEEPFALITRTAPDLVIQDVRLGQTLTIWSLLEHLESLAFDRRPQVLVCSADRDFLRLHREELEDRSCAVVEKPFDIDTFLDAVAACLEPLRR